MLLSFWHVRVHSKRNFDFFSMAHIACIIGWRSQKKYFFPKIFGKKIFLFFVWIVQLRKRIRKLTSDSCCSSFVEELTRGIRFPIEFFPNWFVKNSERQIHFCLFLVFFFFFSWVERNREFASGVVTSKKELRKNLVKKVTWLILPVAYACLKD